MITMAKSESVASRVLERLDTLHHERRSHRLLRSLVWTVAIMLFVSAAAIICDAIFGWWSVGTRLVISGMALLFVLSWFVPAMRKSFFRDDKESLASFADNRTPVMQERMQTLISVSQRPVRDTGVDRLMLERVARETDELIDQFNPCAAAVESSIKRPLIAVALGLVLWSVLALWIGGDLGVLVGRFLAPTSSLTRYQVDGIVRDAVVARGEPFTLELIGRGATANSITLERRFEGNHSIDAASVVESIRLTSEDRRFQFRQRRSEESFDYRVLVGDLRTPWNRVTVATRPRVKNVSLVVMPPAYSHLPSRSYSRMPNRLTVIEGSRIELAASVVGEVELSMLQIEGEPARTMLARQNQDGNQQFVVALQADKDMNLAVEVTEIHGLKNLRKPKCHVLTRPDLPPTVRIDSPSPDQEVRPDDTIELQFTAKDDVGLARAKLIVQVEHEESFTNADGKPAMPIVLETVDLPVPKSGKNDGKPLTNWKGKTQLDLSKFELKEGQLLSYRIEVFDTKQAEILESIEEQKIQSGSTNSSDEQEGHFEESLQGDGESKGIANASSSREISKSSGNRSASAEMPSSEVASRGSSESDASGESKMMKTENRDVGYTPPEASRSDVGEIESNQSEVRSSQGGSSVSKAPQPSGESVSSLEPIETTNKEATDSQKSSKSDSSDSMESSDSREPGVPSQPRSQSGKATSSSRSNSNGSNQMSPNPMEMRSPDLPQPSSSKSRRLKVTENVGSFVSESRRKSEVEIARTFRSVDSSLQTARKSLSRVLQGYESSDSKWIKQYSFLALDAHKELDYATEAIKDLIKRTKETPYAFIGLQLAEIAHTHIMPAREDAKSAVDSSGETQWALITASRQQVIRALERLRSLYKTYEKAKRDFKVAKDLQEIEKMYRVYLEDALAELKRAAKDGDGNPGLERTMAELDIDEDYLTRLKEVLEMQRDLRAELARILADDPRLMRRYFQNFGQNGRSIRDQLYDLAKAQRSHYKLAESYGQALQSGNAVDLMSVVNSHASALAIEAMDLVERSLEVEETFETWLPLDETETASIRAARDGFLNIAAAAGDVTTAFESEVAAKVFTAQVDVTNDDLGELFDSSANAMSGLATALDAAASTLAVLPSDEPELIENATRRMIDLQQLQSAVARWHARSTMASEQKYFLAVAVAQVETTNLTHNLTEKLTGLQQELARQVSQDDNKLPEAVATACDDLLEKLDREIEPLQLASIRALQQANVPRAMQRLEAAASGLDEACRLMDEVLKQVIELLDQLPPDPLADLLDDPTLDQILAQLEQERELSEVLGIPRRPTNLQVINDWANGTNGPGGAARMRLLKLIRETMNSEQKKRLQKLMRTRNRLLARHSVSSSSIDDKDVDGGRVFGWNVLRSQLGGSLLQESDGLPPDTYRRSIERYFEIISSAVQEL